MSEKNPRSKQDRWRVRNPWFKHWQHARRRCQDPKHRYYHRYGGRGIQLYLTLDDTRLLWLRDGANLLKQPSLDRVDPNQHYTLVNCRFIELRDNRLQMLYSKVERGIMT